MKKILPILLAVVGLIVGVGAGAMIGSKNSEDSETAACSGNEECHESSGDMAPPAKNGQSYDSNQKWEYVELPKQFVVPIIKKDKVKFLVVLSISIEIDPDDAETAKSKTPKLRDGFLQVLFEHANSGGFDGAFTSGQSMLDLRGSLKAVAQKVIGPSVNSVLIEEIIKQTM